MLNFIKKTGQYTQYAGQFFVLVMAVVGTMAIDLVILAALLKDSERPSRHGHDNHHFFFTLLVWQMMSSNHHRSRDYDFAIQLILSPITTLVAIGLSFVLGVPGVGVGLAIGWGVALSTMVVGYAIEYFANALIHGFSARRPPSSGQSGEDNPASFGNSYANATGYFPEASAPPLPLEADEYSEEPVYIHFSYIKPISVVSSVSMFGRDLINATPVPSAPPCPDYR